MRLSILALAALVGCGEPDSIALDERWRPLERVIRDDTEREDWAYTRVPYVYTKHPASIPDALLAHEQVHARRQLEFGVAAYFAAYRNDARFRTDEELAAYRAQIRYERDVIGWIPDPYFYATALTSYDPPLALTFDQALEWVAKTIQER